MCAKEEEDLPITITMEEVEEEEANYVVPQQQQQIAEEDDEIQCVRQLKDDLRLKSSQLHSLEGKVNQLTELQENHEKDKKLWVASVLGLKDKLQALRDDYRKLCEDAHANSFPDISGITSAIQSLGLQYEELKKKYTEESMERKQLYNELIELKGNIRVFCRCRPLNAEEIASGASSVLQFDDTKDNEVIVNLDGGLKKNFKLDRVFPPEANQEDVFADTAPLVVSVLDGYNVCIFAYGQTGTGKTFTMEGTPGNRGVNFRTLEELFRVAEERKGQWKYDISASVLEVYNEQIRDLLACQAQEGQHAKKLEIRQAAEGSQLVTGLVEAQVRNMDEVWEVLQTGSNARAVGSTNANETSSRSHCILSVLVRGQSSVNGRHFTSKLRLVDLAGSERITKTDVNGERLKEAQCINKSLSALGDVISALATKSSHIPYRNSKLTHLLQDSLGGDSKTLMFVQISPHERDMGETLCSLNLATRVRGVELAPVRRRQDAVEGFKYKQMAERIRQDGKEAKKMEESLQTLDMKFKGREQMCRHLQEKVRELETQLAKEKKARFQCETKLREQQRLSEKLPEKPTLFHQFTSSKTVNRRTPMTKDLTNLLEPLTENKKSSVLASNIKQQESKSKMKRSLTGCFVNGSPLNKENISDSAAPRRKKGRFSISAPAHRTSVLPAARRISMIPMPVSRNAALENSVLPAARKISMIPIPVSRNATLETSVLPAAQRISMIPMPVSRNATVETAETVDLSHQKVITARRTSISTVTRKNFAIPCPRRNSMAILPARINEVSAYKLQLPSNQFHLSVAEKEQNVNNNSPQHDSGLSTIPTPVSLRRLKNARALDRFCWSIQSKLQLNSPVCKTSGTINQKREIKATDSDDNSVAALSLDLKPPPPNDTSRLRRLSATRAWGTHSASVNVRAQRVLCGNRTNLKSDAKEEH